MHILSFISFICNNYDPVLGLYHQLRRDKVLRTQDNMQSIPMIKRLGNWGLERSYLVMKQRLVLRSFGVQSCSLTIKSIQNRPGWVFPTGNVPHKCNGHQKKGRYQFFGNKRNIFFSFFLIFSFCSEHSCYLLSRRCISLFSHPKMGKITVLMSQSYCQNIKR